MSLRTLSVLQWVGLLGGAMVWTAQHVVGYGVGQAKCAEGGRHWGIQFDLWQLVIVGVAGLLVVLAEACAAIVFLRTREESFGDGPDEARIPQGRMHFFAAAALLANLLFLAIPLLSSLGAVFSVLCRQS